MPYDVQVRDVEPHLLAAARGRGRTADYLPRLFQLLDAVWKFLRANPEVRHEGLNVFLYYADADRNLFDTEEGMPIEAGVKVLAPFKGDGTVVCSATPGGTVATTVHFGPYEKLGAAHGAVHAWCKVNNRRLAGPRWELYGHWDDDPTQLRTDVSYLLR